MSNTIHTSQHTPRVSVVLTVYNREKYLSEAIDSILNQSFKDFELIIANDGSSDNSLQIAQSYTKLDSRIVLLDKPHTNCAIIRNHALKITRGYYTAIMDSDDASTPDRLEKQVTFLDSNPDHVAVGSWLHRMDPNGNSLGIKMLPTDHSTIDNLHITGNAGAIAHGPLLYRTQSLRDIGGYTQRPYAIDYDLLLKLGEQGKIANIPEPLYLWRHHLKSCSYAKSVEQSECAHQSWLDACHRRGLSIDPTINNNFKNITVNKKRNSKADDLKIWSSYARNYGQLSVARKHAIHALAYSPFNIDSWRIFKWALTG